MNDNVVHNSHSSSRLTGFLDFLICFIWGKEGLMAKRWGGEVGVWWDQYSDE